MLLLVIQLSAHAAERLVSNLEEFETAVKQVSPGDEIVLKDGIWENIELDFEAEGTEPQPITLRPQTPGKAVITGASQLRIGGRYLVVDGLNFTRAYHHDHLIQFRHDSKRLAYDCRLTNCTIIDCNGTDAADESRWISVYGERNRIDHCWIEGKTNKGTTLVVWVTNKPNHNRIDHNYFGPRERLGKNGGETIRVGDSNTSLESSHTIVEENLFDRCNGENEIISNKSCENVYRSNTFLRCSGTLTLRHGNDCLVEGNYFLGDRARGSGGVRIIGENHRVVSNYFQNLEGDDLRAALVIMNGIENSPADGYVPVKNAVVAFNTFVNCKETFVIGATEEDEVSVPPADCVIANNLIVSRRPAIIVQTPPNSTKWVGNLLYQSGDADVVVEGVKQVHSSLLQPAGELWRPMQQSPAIDTAEGEFDWVRLDIDGQERGAAKDVGCDEVMSQSPGRTRPFYDSVGPAWKRPRSP